MAKLHRRRIYFSPSLPFWRSRNLGKERVSTRAKHELLFISKAQLYLFAVASHNGHVLHLHILVTLTYTREQHKK